MVSSSEDVPAKKKKKNASDDEAFEESDDGDEEGRECDYISDSTDVESENEQHGTVKSVAEEDALRKLLASDEDDEDEEQNEKKEGEEDGSSDAEAKDKDDKVSTFFCINKFISVYLFQRPRKTLRFHSPGQ